MNHLPTHFLPLFQHAIASQVSDIFLASNRPPILKKQEHILPVEYARHSSHELATLAQHLLTLEQQREWEQQGTTQAMCQILEQRFRVTAHQQHTQDITFAFRRVHHCETNTLPNSILSSLTHSGLTIISGTQNSGKSATAAALIHQLLAKGSRVLCFEECTEHNYTFPQTAHIFHFAKQNISSATDLAWQLAADTIFIDRINQSYQAQMVCELLQQGCRVIITLNAHDAIAAVHYFLKLLPNNEWATHTTAHHLQHSIHQQLITNTQTLHTFAVFDTLPNSANIRQAIMQHQFTALREWQADGEQGAIKADEQLIALYQQGNITAEQALQATLNPEKLALELHIQAHQKHAYLQDRIRDLSLR